MAGPHPVTDPGWVEPEHHSAFDRAMLPYLKDPRDLVFARTAAATTAFLAPTALALYVLPTVIVAALALPYWFVLFTRFTGRYVLMLHATGHRPIFKRSHAWMERYIPWVLAPFFGQTPNSFFAHHMGMHHPENNLDDDLSSTMAYQRDSFVHFLHYWARFFFVGTVHLARYLMLRRRKKLLRRWVAGELSWHLAIVALLWLNPVATLVVFVVPFLVMRVAMMTGNWSQHAFVDIDDPGNAYKNSTCLTNTSYNHKCFNDGYHIVHHLKPALHWTEMATEFQKTWPQYVENDAVVFSGIQDNQRVFVALMRKDYRFLAEHFVQMGEQQRSIEEIEELLRARVQRRRGTIKGLVAFTESDGRRPAAEPLAAK